MTTQDADDPFLNGLPTIEATRVRLRAMTERDASDVYRLYADKDAVRYGYAPKMESLDDARHVIDQTISLAKERTIFHFGVADRQDDRILGHATLFHWERAHRRAELGYSIHRTSWGRGLGTEAAAALLTFSFERLDIRRMEADVDPRNGASLRVLEKLGFVREGFMRERWELAGELQDGIFLGLLRREWRARAER